MTDWPALIERIERYHSHLEIGLEVGRSEGWVGHLKRGLITDPAHSVAVKLIAMERAIDSGETTKRTQDSKVENSE